MPSISFPRGFEQKYDAASQKYYYVDHANQRTQWEDPRLHHPAIWQAEQLELLEKFKASFVTVSNEDILRQALINTCFDGKEATHYLITAGCLPVSSTAATSPGLASTRRSEGSRSSTHTRVDRGSPVGNTATTVRDDESQAVIKILNHYPDAGFAVVREVLSTCDGNVKEAEEQLKLLGFHRKGGVGGGRQSRSRADNAVTERSVDHAVGDAEMWGNLREKAKNADLVQQKAADMDMKKRVKVMLGIEFPSVDASVIERITSSVDDISQCRVALRQINADAKSAQTHPKRIIASAFTNSAHSSPTSNNRIAAEPMESRRRLIRHEGESDANENRPGSSNAMTNVLVGPTESSKAIRRSLAHGPDASLCKGPDSALLTGVSKLAIGPDPSLSCGPASKLAHGANVQLLSGTC